MKVYTILGGTGSTGSAVIRALLSTADPGDVNVRVYVRSAPRLLALLPELKTAPNFIVIEGSLNDAEVLADALREADVVFSCIATNTSEPGTSIAVDTAAFTISALQRLKSEQNNYKPPTILMLSSASLNPALGKAPALVKIALYYLYADLERAQEMYLSEATSEAPLLNVVFVQPPGILPGIVPTGHKLITSADDPRATISFADLGAGMVELAERWEEFAGKGVGLRATGKVGNNWGPNLRNLAVGLFTYYMPWFWRVGRSVGVW